MRRLILGCALAWAGGYLLTPLPMVGLALVVAAFVVAQAPALRQVGRDGTPG